MKWLNGQSLSHTTPFHFGSKNTRQGDELLKVCSNFLVVFFRKTGGNNREI
jgi:hypothetical protein